MNAYPSVGYLSIVSEQLQVYLPVRVSDNTKPKREAQIKLAYGEIYTAQLLTNSVIRDIEASHLLGINDVVVPHLVREYAMLGFALRTLTDRLKVMKQFDGDLDGAVSEVIGSFNVKELGSRLYSDLKYLSERFNLDLDLKECMKEFKIYEPSEDFVKRVAGER